jgi:hypothetical protein
MSPFLIRTLVSTANSMCVSLHVSSLALSSVRTPSLQIACVCLHVSSLALCLRLGRHPWRKTVLETVTPLLWLHATSGYVTINNSYSWCSYLQPIKNNILCISALTLEFNDGSFNTWIPHIRQGLKKWVPTCTSRYAHTVKCTWQPKSSEGGWHHVVSASNFWCKFGTRQQIPELCVSRYLPVAMTANCRQAIQRGTGMAEGKCE